MFGYVMADRKNLSVDDYARYKRFYCGLCRTIQKNHGIRSMHTLTYDMTFLTVLQSDLYGLSDDVTGLERCIIHPVKKHEYTVTEVTEYAAAMNVALAYYNCLDDWNDDKNVIKGADAAILKREYRKIKNRYPEKCRCIEECIKKLSEMEIRGEMNPDIPSACFGELMGELFIYKDDDYREILYSFGFNLGKLIYIIDACCDIKTDLRKQKYNPMTALKESEYEEILDMLSGLCTNSFKQIPHACDDAILINILYSGIRLKYAYKMQKDSKKYNRNERGGK